MGGDGIANANIVSEDGASFERIHGRALVQVLSDILEDLVEKNNLIPTEQCQPTKFHAVRPPGIGIYDYLFRIFKYASCSPECFVFALVYIDRLINLSSLVLNSLNVHRIIITSVMLAAKFFDDQYFNNAYYAKVGGVPCAEINSLELEFLFLTKFSLHVSPQAYEKYYNELTSHHTFIETMSVHFHAIQPKPRENGELIYITKHTPVNDDVDCRGEMLTKIDSSSRKRQASHSIGIKVPG